MPVVNNCCRCISLRTASITIGSVDLGWSLLLFFLIPLRKTKYKFVGYELGHTAVIIICLLYFGTMALISILLIVGGAKMKKSFVLPWLYLGAILKFGSLLSLLLSGIMYIVKGEVIMGVHAIIFFLCILGLTIYFWIVVYSFYQMLKARSQNDYQQ